jgi:predicted nuclease of predicted toxin-antitoxin system
LSLRLLVDEDTQAKALARHLRDAGHDVVTVPEVGLAAVVDERILEYSRRENRILLTRNGEDFQALHQSNSEHSGIVVVYVDRVVSKRMSRSDIVRALANLEASGLDLAGQFIPLNAWSY